MKLVYVEQFDAWWALPPEEWRALLARGAEGYGHILPPERQLRVRPRCVRSERWADGERSYHSLDPKRPVYSPLDWEPEDYRHALEELTAAG